MGLQKIYSPLGRGAGKIFLILLYFPPVGGAVASWLVRSTPE